MGTDIEKFFKDEGYTFLTKPAKEQKIHFKNFVYTDEFKKYSIRRKSYYTDYYSKLKKDLYGILKSSENKFQKNGRRKILDGGNKEGIALAILAMRNQLFDQAQYSNMEKAYKAGYDIPEKIIGVKLTDDDRTDHTDISKSNDEFRADIDRFIINLSERIDKIIGEHEEKQEKGMGWTWVALSAALFAAIDAMEYRIGYIAIEPFRLSYRLGAVHGIVKAANKKGITIKKWLWETTSANPCENCLALDGTEVTMEEAERFLHPNCQCTLTIIVE
ncbi:hypothetical protein A2Z67_06320 [Candidatus Woesebacteria bacterium RBG_13_36_22]|uniref:Uncharacterized protein n=1 Tax=Candidatus Woesebacteria bacterium RBG_13_36_22 TaxID=1802478 RepID=A0A1F7WZB8_9BACT|nr:MAG: hypothetical protein A2Z67_06320 [Candidatus Woesebacteria bacterium RBG_13_36_22]